MKSLLDEFKTFIARGNVFDLAVGIIIGAAFNDIVKSLVNDIIMPPIGKLMNNVNFADLFINLGDGDFKTLAAAQEAGAATINYGQFLNTVINFLIVALVVFLLIKQVNRFMAKPKPAEPNTKPCPYCKTDIPIAAVRCPHCTSQLEETAGAR